MECFKIKYTFRKPVSSATIVVKGAIDYEPKFTRHSQRMDTTS